MGEDAHESRRPTHERPDLSNTRVVETFDVIAGFYGLNDEMAFHELTEYLVGLSCRDQEDEFVVAELIADGDLEMSERRAEGHRLALALREQATRALDAIDAIDDTLVRFDAVVKIHPPLLEAIFETDTGDPRNLYFPDHLAILLNYFGKADWEQVVQTLTQLSTLPVRSKLARGPIQNKTLRRAVAACRDYWCVAEKRRWSMSSLKVKSVRVEKNTRHLKGRCEAFVSDILTQCDIQYDLQDLCSAWTAVDRDART